MLPCDYQDESEFEVKDGYYSDGEYCDKIRSEFENTTNDISKDCTDSPGCQCCNQNANRNRFFAPV